jgi:pyruvate-formate lyase-activating enzyme
MANNQKTIYTVNCKFNCDFCDNKTIEIRKYKGSEKGGIYGYTACGMSLRPPQILAKKIFDNGTMQKKEQLQEKQQQLHSKVDDQIKPKKSKDYFANLWDGE